MGKIKSLYLPIRETPKGIKNFLKWNFLNVAYLEYPEYLRELIDLAVIPHSSNDLETALHKTSVRLAQDKQGKPISWIVDFLREMFQHLRYWQDSSDWQIRGFFSIKIIGSDGNFDPEGLSQAPLLPPLTLEQWHPSVPENSVSTEKVTLRADPNDKRPAYVFDGYRDYAYAMVDQYIEDQKKAWESWGLRLRPEDRNGLNDRLRIIVLRAVGKKSVFEIERQFELGSSKVNKNRSPNPSQTYIKRAIRELKQELDLGDMVELKRGRKR